MIRRDVTVAQGADHREDIPDLDGQGNAPDRSGWRAFAAVRHSPDGPLVYEPRAVVGPGRVELHIPGGESLGWLWRRARYEVVLVGPRGERERFAYGRVMLDRTLVQR